MNNNITNYLNEFAVHINEIQKNYNYLKEALIEVESNEREFRLISSNLIEINNESAIAYWDNIVNERITDQKMCFALIVSVCPFLVSLVMLLIGLAITSHLFNLRRKYKRRTDKANKTLIFVSDKNGYKISVVDEMKRNRRHSSIVPNQIHPFHYHHKLNATDFNLPDERKVPIVLVQDELAKDQRALETLKNLNPIQLNVNNLPIDPTVTELKRITTAELIRALQNSQMTYNEANEMAIKNKLCHRNISPGRILKNNNDEMPSTSSSSLKINELKSKKSSSTSSSTSIEMEACTSSSLTPTTAKSDEPQNNKTYGKFTVNKISTQQNDKNVVTQFSISNDTRL